MKFLNKKSMEMSLNLIIFLIIGLTVLGLVIGFVTGFMGDATSSFEDQIGADDAIQLEQILNEPGTFVVSPRSLTVQKGDDNPRLIYVKVRNPIAGTMTIGSIVTDDYDDSDLRGELEPGRGVIVLDDTTGQLDTGETHFEIFSQPMVLNGGEQESFGLQVYTTQNTEIGTYYLTLFLCAEGTDTETSCSGNGDSDKQESIVITISVE